MSESSDTGTSRPRWYVRRHGKPPFFRSTVDVRDFIIGVTVLLAIIGIYAGFVYMIVSIK